MWSVTESFEQSQGKTRNVRKLSGSEMSQLVFRKSVKIVAAREHMILVNVYLENREKLNLVYL